MTDTRPTFSFDRFMADWRAVRHKDGARITQAELDLVRSAIEGTYSPRPQVAPSPTAGDPRWMATAREWIGTKEIPGPKHNPAIVKMRKALPFNFNDDDVPWCGDFVAHCIQAAGLPIPKMYPRAMAWAEWGKPCPPTVGAVVVFKRQGGGHVGFLVGESPANYYVLGGNQSDAVNIMPIAKNRLAPNGIRWPVSLGLPTAGLPKMTGGVVSTNEA